MKNLATLDPLARRSISNAGWFPRVPTRPAFNTSLVAIIPLGGWETGGASEQRRRHQLQDASPFWRWDMAGLAYVFKQIYCKISESGLPAASLPAIRSHIRSLCFPKVETARSHSRSRGSNLVEHGCRHDQVRKLDKAKSASA